MKIVHETRLTPEQVAEAFCELNDDQMALFFEEVGKIAKDWKGSAGMQWYLTGQHMKSCACVTDIGRSVVDEIHDSLHYQG